jgi:hypothetical protein
LLLRAAFLGAKAVGHMKMLINEQTLPQHHGNDVCGRLEAVGDKQA